jgi:hypothetical protein
VEVAHGLLSTGEHHGHGYCRTLHTVTDGAPVCSACVQRQFLGLPSSEPRARRATRFLLAHAVVDGLSVLLNLSALAAGSSTLLTVVEGFAGLGTFVAAIGTMITFLMWLHLAVRQAEALEIDVGVTPGWAVGYWFIPFANLVRPYNAVRSLLTRLGGEALAREARVGLWWGMWIVGNVLAQIETRMTMSGGLDAPTSSEAHVVGVFSSLSSVIGAILCIGVVRSIQRALDAKRP